MPPRPRPKPKPKATTSTVVEDEDSMFIKNKARSLQNWKKLDEIGNKGTRHGRGSDSDDDDDDEDESPRSKKLKRNKGDQSSIPAWQKEKNLKRLLSSGPDDEDDGSDSDVQIIEVSDSQKHDFRRKKRAGSPSTSRARSLTPPPDVAFSEILAARNIVRQTLKSSPRKQNSDDELGDISVETIYQDPELDRIARSAKSSFQQSHSTVESTDPDDKVEITVKWIPHPQKPNGNERTFLFTVLRHDNLRALFDATAEEAMVLESQVVIQYKGHQLFSSVTPNTLKIYTAAEFLACDKITFNYLKANGGFSRYATGYRPPTPEPESQTTNNGEEEIGADPEGDSEGTFSIILRSSATRGKDITLTVRPTTKCGAIVKAFLKKAGLDEQYSVRKKKGAKNVSLPKLSIDGERMGDEVEIGEQDLEDGDVVDVDGL